MERVVCGEARLVEVPLCEAEGVQPDGLPNGVTDLPLVGTPALCMWIPMVCGEEGLDVVPSCEAVGVMSDGLPDGVTGLPLVWPWRRGNLVRVLKRGRKARMRHF